MEQQEVADIFVDEIETGNHGTFLVYFMQAYCHADYENRKLLRLVAEEMIRKYALRKHS